MTAGSVLKQLRAWRSRWRGDPPDEDTLNRAVAVTFATPSGKATLDYLINTYYKPLSFLGGMDDLKLAERNGQQLLIVDLLLRIDKATHPLAFEPDGKDDGRPVDVRMLP